MRLIQVTGRKPDVQLVQIDKDVWVLISDDEGALGATLVADRGSISVGSARARWRSFVKDANARDLYESPADTAKDLRKWLKREGLSYE